VRDEIKNWIAKSFCKRNDSETSPLEYV